MIEFEQFWRSYPRRVGRKIAERCWNKLREAEREKVMRGLELWKQTVQWQSNDGMFVPYASTFLNQQRYLDEPWTGAFSEVRCVPADRRTPRGIQQKEQPMTPELAAVFERVEQHQRDYWKKKAEAEAERKRLHYGWRR